MEMHQVRYFLAVCEEQNFTRAAEKCNVAQPSLTRAIKLLEGELGGELFRRERPRALLTPLAERIYPNLKQCYDSALSARAIAASVNEGQSGVLKIAVSNSIELGLILAQVNELKNRFGDLELKVLRGTGPQILEQLKAGDAELGVAAAMGDSWDRLDRWKLFDEPFDLVFSPRHRLANQETVALDDLRRERLLMRGHCENAEDLVAVLNASGFSVDRSHDVASDHDLLALIDANIGIGFLPRTVTALTPVVRTAVEGIDLQRTVFLYGVAGRQRSLVATTFMKTLRAVKWPQPAI
jgi:DNA-binding transcriptional LysR family regulator